MKIKVLLADDHRIIRESLRALLENEADISIVAEAGNGIEALQLADQHNPHVVLMDISMPVLNGIDATKQLLDKHAGIKVIALSAHDDQRYLVRMIKAGTSGYIIKSNASAELLRAIRAVHNNQTYFCAEVSSALAEATNRHPSLAAPPLGRREEEVLKLLAEGMHAPEIGSHLHIAPSTVEVHRRNIMLKLGLHNIVELTKYAIRQGLVEC
ncbi:MAG: response regulator transcription factor [Methylococcaceae bacterium]|nr:MAG: response regulator transcription factor [Methylococcaceae bacterium]